jgi:hypothetical protein
VPKERGHLLDSIMDWTINMSVMPKRFCHPILFCSIT